MQIRKIIQKAIESVVNKDISFGLEHPTDETHGDYASNVAMLVFSDKDLRSKWKVGNPRELAKILMDELCKNTELMSVVDKIEVAGGGFLNFFLKKSWLLSELREIVQKGKDYGRGDWGRGRRVLVDYSAPNIAKSFNVGHLRSTIIGQSIRNIYEFSGWKSVGDNHLGDWGTQFGMIIAAVEEGNLDISEMSVEEIEKMYVEFNKRAKEDLSLRDRAKLAFVRLEKGERSAREIWQTAVNLSMVEFERVYKILGVKIEYAYGESFYENMMKDVILELKDKNIAVESQGALVAELGGDLGVAMFVKSDGGTTYLTRDLAAVKFREENEELRSDLYVYEVGAEQSLHFKQLFEIVERLGWKSKSNFVHLAHGLILGSDGKKMSTRKGTGIKMQELLKRAIDKAEKINKESAEVVGVGAVKFFDLRHSPESSYKFDLERAISLNGDTGPYLQYSVVRCRAILTKSDIKGKFDVPEISLNEKELEILSWLYRFSEVVEETATKYSPNLLCVYLIELARRFNGFYNKHKVLGENDTKRQSFRLSLVKGVEQVLENGLALLGIEVPERM